MKKNVNSVFLLLLASLSMTLWGACSTLGGKVASHVASNVWENKFGDKAPNDTVILPRLLGTWQYVQPGCAFHDIKDSLLLAGSRAVGDRMRLGLQPAFEKAGIGASNTSLTLHPEGSYSVTIAGKTINGTYTFNAAECKLTLQGILFNSVCHVVPGDSVSSFLFDSKKFQKLLKVTSLFSKSGSAVDDFAGDYAGMRIGFEMKKKK